jgi:hypothetical protein
METNEEKITIKRGRPTKYKKEYIKKVDEYLDICQDGEKQVVKYEGEHSTGYETKIVVKLPTIEGFSLFIDVPNRCIYDWKEKYEDFSQSLDKIVKVQKERLIGNGLSGDYNSTIAKLILSSNHGMREKSDVTSDDKPIQSNTIIIKDFSKDEE